MFYCTSHGFFSTKIFVFFPHNFFPIISCNISWSLSRVSLILSHDVFYVTFSFKFLILLLKLFFFPYRFQYPLNIIMRSIRDIFNILLDNQISKFSIFLYVNTLLIFRFCFRGVTQRYITP